MEMKKQLSCKGMFAGLTARQWDAQWTLLSAEFPQHTWLTFFADISDDSSILETDPVFKLL